MHVPRAMREARTPGGVDSPLPLFALGAPDVLAALGPIVPEVGAWAEYAVRIQGQPDTRVRVSLLPPALEQGRRWLEVVSVDAAGGTLAAKTLSHGDLSRSKDLERAFIYLSGQAPIEIPLAQLREQLEAEEVPGAAKVKVVKAAAAEVTVPAGTFYAESLRISRKGEDETQLWRSKAVPLWGLVRAKSKKQTVELIGFARTGAHSVLPKGYGDEVAPPAPARAPAQGNGNDKVK